MARAVKKKAETEDSDLVESIKRFEDFIDSTTDARAKAERDRDYYDGKQWTDAEIAELTKRKQPPVVINRIKPKVDFLLGTERQTRTDPKCFPRTPQHEQDAGAATDAIRFVCDKNRFEYLRSEVFECLAIEGIGAAIIEVEDKGKQVDIVIRRIPWDRYYCDPHSRERGFTDKSYDGIVIWMDGSDLKRMYPGKDSVIDEAFTEAVADQTFGDKPISAWVTADRKRTRVCEEYYRKDGKWHHCVFTKSGYLVPPEVSKFVDEDGPCNPIEAISAFIDRDGARYGAVRQFISVQDEINKRRSKALHLLSVRQTIGEVGAVENVNKAKAEMAKPDGHVEVSPGMRFEIAQTGDMAAGQFTLLAEAKQEIDAVGANAALQGKQEGSSSGRALQARQQSGMMELGPLFDALRQWQKAVYRQVWNRVRQYWTGEMWVRVTDDEKNLKWVGLNKPITAGEQMIEQMKSQGQQITPEMIQQIAMDPRSREVVGKRNEVAQLDVDIIVDEAPDTVNLQAEQFELLTQMYQATPDVIPPDLVLEMSSLRNKDKVLERVRGGMEANAKKEQERYQAEAMNAQQLAAIEAYKADTTRTLGELKLSLEAQQFNKEQVMEAMQMRFDAFQASHAAAMSDRDHEMALTQQAVPEMQGQIEQMRAQPPIVMPIERGVVVKDIKAVKLPDGTWQGQIIERPVEAVEPVGTVN